MWKKRGEKGKEGFFPLHYIVTILGSWGRSQSQGVKEEKKKKGKKKLFGVFDALWFAIQITL